MAESVADLLDRLSFVGGPPVESLYLNETRVRENFINSLGAIESFTRTATKTISGETPIVKIGAEGSAKADVVWSLKDPITQALLLRAALKSSGSLHGLDSVAPGRFISFAGNGIISRPGLFDGVQRESLQGYPGLYESLEGERADVEKTIAITQAPRNHWLLTVTEGPSVCFAILDDRWLNDTWPDWIDRGYRLEIFGLSRLHHESGIPRLATIYLSVKW